MMADAMNAERVNVNGNVKAQGQMRAVGIVAAATTLLSLAGCQRPLLSPEEARTPFEAYDDVRGQRVPQKITNEFGREQVNLRQRLAPKE